MITQTRVAPVIRNARSIGLIFLVIGLLGVLAAVVFPAVARASSGHHVQVDVGDGFTAQPHGAIIDAKRLAPGYSVSGMMGVRSDFDGASELDLKIIDVVAHDGCAPTRSVAGRDCGHGAGQLENELRFDISLAGSPHGPFRPAWSGRAAELRHGVSIGDRVDAGDARWIRMSVRLPRSSGNETQSDTFEFGVRVTMTSALGSDTVSVSDHRSGSRLALAVTGASFALLGIGALVLIVCGVIALTSAKHRPPRRRTG